MVFIGSQERKISKFFGFVNEVFHDIGEDVDHVLGVIWLSWPFIKRYDVQNCEDFVPRISSIACSNSGQSVPETDG